MAQKFLGPLGKNAAVLSEEALRARDISLYGQSGKGDVDDTVVNVDEQVSTVVAPKPHGAFVKAVRCLVSNNGPWSLGCCLHV